MKIFADENLYEPIIDYLRNNGHDVLSIRDAELSGIKDEKVFQIACKENRVIVTMDKDFSRIFRFPPEKCGGIIVIKIYRRTVLDTLSIFRDFFELIKEEHIFKNLVIITPEGVRIRKSIK